MHPSRPRVATTLLLVGFAALAHAAPARRARPVVSEVRWFALSLASGERLGWAREQLALGPRQIRLEREEHVWLRRGSASPPLEIVTRTASWGDAAGRPLGFRVDSDTGGVARQLTGARRGTGWLVTSSIGSRSVASATPRSWLPVLLRLGRRLPARSVVLLEDRQAARAALRVTAGAPDALTLSLDTRFGSVEERWTLDAAGRVIAAADALFVARQVAEADARAAFEPAELLDRSAVGISDLPDELDDRFRLGLAGFPALPELVGQRVVSTRPTDHGPEVVVELWSPSPPTLGPRAPAPPPNHRARRGTTRAGAVAAADLAPTLLEPSDAPALRALARTAPAGADAWERAAWLSHRVYELLVTKDTAGAPLTATEALAASRGDCTAHAALLGALLKASGIPSRLATGQIVVEGGLRRHRWVLAQIDGVWIPLDPLYDEAPARAGHLALAVHGSTPEELLVDDVLWSWVSGRAPSARWLGGAGDLDDGESDPR